MALTAVSDILNMNCEKLAHLWIRKVRQSTNLRDYNQMNDTDLEKMNSKIYRMLALWFEKEADRNQIGAFFVELGKARQKEGFAVSEVSYALFLAQRAVLEYLTNENLIDSSMALYTIVNLTGQVADFFFLGSYYMMKGYLEDTYLAMGRNEAMSDEILKKYFKDEFFFKDSSQKY
jgi:hypothetical protein